MDTRKCTDCGVVKSTLEFYRNKKNKRGIQSYCKKCQGARKKARKYGITFSKFKQLRASNCEICGENSETKIMCIDHCHSSGEVRGALCGQCNSGIGMFKESVDLLIRACEYLVKKTM